MDKFRYKARSQTGEVVTDVIEAPNAEAVAVEIRRRHLYVTEIVKITDRASSFSNIFQENIGIYDVSVFCRQFATLLQAGVTLINSIEILGAQVEKPRFKNVLMEVSAKVREGNSLSSTMEKYPNVFPALLINMVAAGEAAGILDVVMERMATQMEKDYRMNQRFKNAMVYPAIVLSVAALSCGIIMKFVMPVFIGLFEELKIPLPGVTRAIIFVSKIVSEYWWLIIGGIFLFVLFYKHVLLKNSKFVLMQDRLFLHVPIFGTLYTKIIITRFARTFASLSRAGVPILASLVIVARATGSVEAERILTEARGSLTQGGSLAEPMESSGLFPPMVVSLTRIGEETGRLDAMLDKVAEFYSNEVDDTISRLQTIMDPILIVILGFVIGTMAVGLLLPLFEIVTKVGQV